MSSLGPRPSSVSPRRRIALVAGALVCGLGLAAGPVLGSGGARAADHGSRHARGAVPLAHGAAGHTALRVFASADEIGSGTELELRSTRTGRVVRRLARFGARFTNNGLALSPDGRAVYFTLIPRGRHWTSLLLERIGVADRRRTVIGPGEEPAVSPSGRLLAYTTDARQAQSVVVVDLTTRRRRSIDLHRLIGRRGDLLAAFLAWSGDSSTIVVSPGSVAVATAGGTHTSGPRQTAGTAPGATNLIVIRVRPNGAPLSVRRVPVPGLGESVSLLATAASRPGTVLAGELEARSTAIDAIRFSPRGPTVRRLAAIRDGLIDAFDPTGRQVLYLQGHSPPALWRATLSAGGLTDRHRLFRRSPVGATAW